MPCCNLTEFRSSVPARFMLLGLAIFWGTFFVTLVLGVLLVWHPLGREMLSTLWAFLRALWLETMRNRDSKVSRWACRVSGVFLPVSPTLAGTLCRRPEIPLGLLFLSVVALFAGVAWSVAALVS